MKPKQSQTIQILVVEDERVVARDIKACLESLGYTVPATAASGEDAIAKARAILPDIVLMDIQLEGQIDGIEAAEQIWDSLQIPVIYTTGHSDRATVERAVATEPFGYILKPIKEHDLYIAIAMVLQRYQLFLKGKAFSENLPKAQNIEQM
jgi:CheY-like chemotaxis protein